MNGSWIFCFLVFFYQCLLRELGTFTSPVLLAITKLQKRSVVTICQVQAELRAEGCRKGTMGLEAVTDGNEEAEAQRGRATCLRS